MGVLRAIRLAVVLAVLGLPLAASAAEPRLRVIQFDTHSSVRIAHFAFGTMTWGTSTRVTSTEAAIFTCVTFGNTDERPATEVRFHFAEFDTPGALVHEDDLVRSGTFSQNVVIESINEKSGKFNQEDCVLNPPRLSHGGLIVVFVKSVKYRDGSVWSTPGPAIPDHLDTGATP